MGAVDRLDGGETKGAKMKREMPFPVRPLIASDPMAEPPERLRRRAGRHGYLYVRRLVDAGEVSRLHARAVESSAGLIRSEVPPKGPGGQWDPRWLEWHQAMASTPELPPLLRNLAVVRLLETVTRQAVEPIPAQVFRALEPRRPEAVTPPHQDAFYLGPAGGGFWVAWLPLHPCPLDLGPLALLRGSHRGGLLPHDRTDGGGNGAVLPATALESPWDAGPMEPGDVLLFHHLTVHRSCPNRTVGQFRFSLDFRLRLAAR